MGPSNQTTTYVKAPNPRRKRNKKPDMTNDQAVLNRMPFAKHSLGISTWQGPMAETSHDLTRRTNNATRLFQLCQRQNFNRTGTDASLELAYLADAPPVSINTHETRPHDMTHHEDIVPQEYTAGHTIWVAGNAQQPWIWCNTCGAYTNQSVRKLAKKCLGKGQLTHTDRLMMGLEPKTKKRMHGNARRLTWADVGGKPHTLDDSTNQEVTRACLTHLYWKAYRTLRRRDMEVSITQERPNQRHQRPNRCARGPQATPMQIPLTSRSRNTSGRLAEAHHACWARDRPGCRPYWGSFH